MDTRLHSEVPGAVKVHRQPVWQLLLGPGQWTSCKSWPFDSFSQTMVVLSFVCLPVLFVSLPISIFPPLFAGSSLLCPGVFNILCWLLNPSPSLCLPSSVLSLWTVHLLSPGKMISCIPKSNICDLLKYRGRNYHLPLSFFLASLYVPSPLMSSL